MTNARTLVKTFATAALAAGITCSAPAQEVLTMERAVDMALDGNLSLQGAMHDRDAARWGKLNAFSNFLPKVNVNSGITRIDMDSYRRANAAIDFIKESAGALGIPQSALADLRPFAYRETYTTDLTLVQPIYNGGAEVLGVETADAIRDRTDSGYEETRQEVVARVKISYLTVLKAEELLNLARESTERTQRYLDMTRRREEMGMRTHTDVLRWEVQLASARGAEINAGNALAASQLQLNEVMGVDLNATYTLEKIPVADSATVAGASASVPVQLASMSSTPPVGTLPENFLETHPSVRAMEANLRLADLGVSKAWVNFKPRVNLAFQYGWEQNNTFALDGIRPWALSLSVSFPVFNGFGDYTGLEQARAEYERTETQMDAFRRSIQVQATNAGLNVNATRQRVDVARKGLQQAEEVLGSVTRRYDTGLASNVDLIDAQTAYTSAKTEYITAAYDYSIAEIQLARAMGKVSR